MRPSTAARVFAVMLALASAPTIAMGEDKTLPMVQGEIKKIDESAGKVTIKHAAIPNLDMDPMTMVFKAADPAMLAEVKPGDKVLFSVDAVNGQLTVMRLEKAK